MADHTLNGRINWLTIVIEFVLQLILFVSILVGYIISNERWKGGMEATVKQVADYNVTQKEINVRMQLAIDKLTENLSVVTANQQRVIGLLDYHMSDDAKKFQRLQKEPAP